MNNSNLPAVIYHDLSDLVNYADLNVALSAAAQNLSKGHITSIVNAFHANTRVSVNGIPYIRVQGISVILRTGNSKAERPLIYRGISGIIKNAELVTIDSEEFIAGPSLAGLLSARINLSDVKTRLYLEVAMNIYYKIANLSEIRDLRDLFIANIEENRPRLKNDRINFYGVTSCEFSSTRIENSSQVEFAHIESVVSNPFKALDIDNGVIILKKYHRELTNAGIHDFEGMYEFCTKNSLSTGWAK